MSSFTRSKHKSSFTCSSLPDELVIEILRRLPVKTIIRFYCVCKSWRSIIKDPFFISKHLNHSTNSPYVLRLGEYDSLSPVLSTNTLDRIATQKIPYFMNSPSLDVVGSCNGLICLADACKGLVYIWNPSIRKYTPLNTTGCYRDFVVFGFGFYPLTNEYKVVKIRYIGRFGTEVEVYTHNTGMWRRISEGPGFDYIWRCLPNVFFNGAIHWVACVRPVNGEQVIITFDIGSEKFQKIKLPTENWIHEGRVKSVMLIEELLGIFVSCQKYPRNNIWVMKHYGVVASWTKLYTIELRQEVDNLSPYLSKANRSLLLQDGNSIVLYNPEKCQFRRIGNIDGPRTISWITFVESLMWLERGNASQINHQNLDVSRS